MKNVVFCDVTPYDSCNNRRFRERIAYIIRMTRISELRTTLAVTSNYSTVRRSCGSCKNQRLGEIYPLHLQGQKNQRIRKVSCNKQNLRRLFQLLVVANVVPSLLIPLILMIEAICSSETSVITRPTLPYIPEDGILHSHLSENHKSYRWTKCSA
jgi:hypothetical protein